MPFTSGRNRIGFSAGIELTTATAFREVQNKVSSFVPGLANPGAGGRPGALGFAGSGDYGSSFQDNWKKGFGPRFGIAYEVNKRTVIRASTGISGAGVMKPPICLAPKR